MNTVMLYSGGLDSLLLALREPDATLVHVNYGQQYLDAERVCIDAQVAAVLTSRPLTVTLTPPLVAQPDGHVPHRNLTLLVLAAAADPEADRVLLGGVRGEASPDKSAAFYRAAGRALSRGRGRRVRVEAPLAARTKAAHLRALVARVGAAEAQRLLDLTSSCYDPPDPDDPSVGCGICQACFRRWVAVQRAGLIGTWRRPPWQQTVTARQAWRHLARQPAGQVVPLLHNQWEAWRALRSFTR